MARDLKTFLGRALLVVNVATAVLAACWWLAVYVAPASMSIPAHGDTGTLRIAVRESGTTDLVALFAALLLVANFLWLVYGGTERAPSPYVLSETPEGKVKVSREAVEAGLRSAGEELEEISRMRAAVQTAPGMRRVVVVAQFHAPDSVAIHAASERLRQTLRRRFAELVRLPEGTRLDIEVEFLGFAGRLQRRPSSEAAPAARKPADDTQPFTGPRYPIDDEDPYGGQRL